MRKIEVCCTSAEDVREAIHGGAIRVDFRSHRCGGRKDTCQCPHTSARRDLLLLRIRGQDNGFRYRILPGSRRGRSRHRGIDTGR